MTRVHLTVTWVKCCWECHDVRAFDCYLSEVLLRVSWRTCIWQLPEWSIVERVMMRVHLTVTWVKCCWECHDVRAFDGYLSEALKREARKSPGMPGRDLKMSMTVNGMICLVQQQKTFHKHEKVGCMIYSKCAMMAAVPRGTSHVITK